MSSIQGRPVNRYGSIIREESDDEMPQQDDMAVSVETRTVSRNWFVFLERKPALCGKYCGYIVPFYKGKLGDSNCILTVY